MAAPAPPRPIVMARHHGHGRTGSAAAGGQRQKTPTQILAAPKTAPARLKVIVRRLPPGLTESEFVQALGDAWRLGGDRVDWLSFREGKVSKDMSKASCPGRAYLHLTKTDFLTPFSTTIKETGFIDAKNTISDSCLIGPPSLEFAPYGRVPTSKPRKDARQGTIDQDMEFIDFLQELTNPVIRPAPLETAEKDNTPNGDAVTPLVQYLRDKKANKVKEATAKTAKQARQEPKDTKNSKVPEKTPKAKETEKTLAPEVKKTPAAIKVEKAARDAVKVLTKQAAAVQKGTQAATSSPPVKTQPPAPENVQPSTAPAERKRGKVGTEAKNLLQRDLGLGGPAAGRRRRGETPGTKATVPNSGSAVTNVAPSKSAAAVQTPHATISTAANSKAASTNPNKAALAPATNVVSQTSPQVPTGPAASRVQSRNQVQQSKSKPATTANGTQVATVEPAHTSSIAATAVTASTQAFLKHANPSQGVTEPLLQEAFAPFGTVKKVEIDKKKGFAYVDFTDSQSLQKAISASPVKVAQGQVVVLERKDGKAVPTRPRGGRAGPAGRGRGGRGGTLAGRADKVAAPQASTPVAASSDGKT